MKRLNYHALGYKRMKSYPIYRPGSTVDKLWAEIQREEAQRKLCQQRAKLRVGL